MSKNTVFPNLDVARRLERAEGYACATFADARRVAFPDSNSGWIDCGGTYASFDALDSPMTQTFGLGLFDEVTPALLDELERFYQAHNSSVNHEVSTFTPVEAMRLLCERGYKPVEVSDVLFQSLERTTSTLPDGVSVQVLQSPEQMPIWTEVNTAGWAHELPELRDFMLEVGAISACRKDSFAFLAEINGVPGAAGGLCIHEGVALLCGAATKPEMRCRGLQNALLQERLRYAADHGCDLAMMVAAPGSKSHRNAERAGFSIAYTRTKWQLK